MIYEEDFLDPSTGIKLTPSPGGRECLGNGMWVGYECCCDECDFFYRLPQFRRGGAL